MSRAHFHKPHHPNNDVPDDFEPSALPVEPDEGPVPALIPDDPEHGRGTHPGANQARPFPPARRQVDVAGCS